mmetsp:Transcript_3216/g.8688  ORF Transcript_3216/g.8688 Transcript_3216/m.8688 type:complete len:206 (-) Transcript_3216:15-632(-)
MRRRKRASERGDRKPERRLPSREVSAAEHADDLRFGFPFALFFVSPQLGLPLRRVRGPAVPGAAQPPPVMVPAVRRCGAASAGSASAEPLRSRAHGIRLRAQRSSSSSTRLARTAPFRRPFPRARRRPAVSHRSPALCLPRRAVPSRVDRRFPIRKSPASPFRFLLSFAPQATRSPPSSPTGSSGIGRFSMRVDGRRFYESGSSL